MEKKLFVKKDRQKNRGALMFLLAVSIFVLGGCTHALHITNLDEHLLNPVPPLREPVKVGVTSSNEMHPMKGRYVTAVVEALKHTNSIEQVVYPYSRATTSTTVDVIVDIAVNPKYDGKGSNFFVNFPGFLIFAPAIWGYGYEADIDTQVSVTNLKNNASQQLAVPTHYEFRHASIGRTWTEVGWFEVGIIPLIGGIVFTGYDTEVTDIFISKVSGDYGPYIANKIITALPQ